MSAPADFVQIGGARPRGALLPASETDRWRDLHPRFAHVYVENKCNLKCAHCYESEETHPTHVRTALPDYERILDGLASIGVLVVTFSGGEPFLRRDFLDIVELARKKRFAVRVYTSGTLLDDRKVARLKALAVSEVHVSLYSHDPATHDGFTGVPSAHSRTLNAIRLLRAAGIRTVMKVTVTTFNVDHLDELVTLAREHDVKLQLGVEVYRRNSGDADPQQFQVPADELRRKVLSRPELYGLVESGDDDDGECNGERDPRLDRTLCAVARRLVTVAADGSMYPCAMFPVAGGNALEDGVEEVWYRSRLFHELRKTTFGSMTSCPTCDVRAGCHPCMAYGYIENGDHRACNSTSRNTAEAVSLLGARRGDAERKMSAGRPLPIIGERHAPVPLEPHVIVSAEEVLQ